MYYCYYYICYLLFFFSFSIRCATFLLILDAVFIVASICISSLLRYGNSYFFYLVSHTIIFSSSVCVCYYLWSSYVWEFLFELYDRNKLVVGVDKTRFAEVNKSACKIGWRNWIWGNSDSVNKAKRAVHVGLRGIFWDWFRQNDNSRQK